MDKQAESSLQNCRSVTIIGNSIKGSMCGIDLLASSDNIIVGNIIQAHTSWTWSQYPEAIMIDLRNDEFHTNATGSSNNLIYDNSFTSNGNLTKIFGISSNSWDNGTVGNYWGDYLTKYPNAVDVDSSSIGNTSYIIDGNNVDHYPLLSQADIIIPVFTLSPTVTATLSPTSTATSTVPEFPALIIPLFSS